MVFAIISASRCKARERILVIADGAVKLDDGGRKEEDAEFEVASQRRVARRTAGKGKSM